jgi:hypothetical protein
VLMIVQRAQFTARQRGTRGPLDAPDSSDAWLLSACLPSRATGLSIAR